VLTRSHMHGAYGSMSPQPAADRCKASKYTRMPMDHERSRGQLKVVLQTHQALEKLESALVEFEVSISEEATLCPQQEHQRGGVQLRSIPQLCQELGRTRAGSTGGCAAGRSLA
jgi:hypothetical protein